MVILFLTASTTAVFGAMYGSSVFAAQSSVSKVTVGGERPTKRFEISGSGESQSSFCPQEITVDVNYQGNTYVGAATLGYSGVFYGTYEYIAFHGTDAIMGTVTFDAIDCMMMWSGLTATTSDYTVEPV
jgi:hypothetical protein